MTTSAKNHDRPLDSKIGSLKEAGLSVPSKVRMKIFKLDSRLIIRKYLWQCQVLEGKAGEPWIGSSAFIERIRRTGPGLCVLL